MYRERRAFSLAGMPFGTGVGRQSFASAKWEFAKLIRAGGGIDALEGKAFRDRVKSLQFINRHKKVFLGGACIKS